MPHGNQGMADAREMVSFTERALNFSKARLSSVRRAHRRHDADGKCEAVELLKQQIARQRNRKCESRPPKQIMTADTRPKQIAVEFCSAEKWFALAASGKARHDSAGNVADWRASRRLAARRIARDDALFITTDAAIDAKVLQIALNEPSRKSFNSHHRGRRHEQNDTVLVLANGLAGNAEVRSPRIQNSEFFERTKPCCLELAKMIVRDGEARSCGRDRAGQRRETVRDADAARAPWQTARW